MGLTKIKMSKEPKEQIELIKMILDHAEEDQMLYEVIYLGLKKMKEDSELIPHEALSLASYDLLGV